MPFHRSMNVLALAVTLFHWRPAAQQSAADTFEVRVEGREPVTHRGAGPNQQSFTPIIQHIQAVITGAETPRLLAVDTALGSALALQDLAGAAKAGA